MKKITAILAVLSMILSFSAYADSADIAVFDVSVNKKDAVVTLDFAFNREIAVEGHQLELAYNTESFEYIGYTPKSEYEKFDVADISEPGEGKIRVILANYQPKTMQGSLISMDFKLLKPVKYNDFQFTAKKSVGKPNIYWNIPKLGGFKTEISNVSLKNDTADISVKYFKDSAESYDASLYIASYENKKLIHIEKTDISDCLQSNSLKMINFPAKNCTNIRTMILQDGNYEPLSISAEFICGEIR